MKGSPGPGGRLTTEFYSRGIARQLYPLHLNGPTSVLSLPTSNGDAITTVIMPTLGWIGRSTLTCSSPGTGTDSPTVAWFSGAGATGSQMTSAHVDSLNANLVWATSGASWSAMGSGLPSAGVDEGGRVFLNVTFGGGSHTVSGSYECTIFLVL